MVKGEGKTGGALYCRSDDAVVAVQNDVGEFDS